MTPQEIFDTVAAHLLAQGARSESAVGSCLYRGPNGLKCAVGALITDDEYTPDMEKIGDVKSLAEEGILPHRLMPHAGLLSALQITHDVIDPENWPEALRKRALRHGLSTAVLP